MKGSALRDGIFALRTRRLGTAAEAMVKRLESLGRASSVFYDLHDEQLNDRVEVKFSTVLRKHQRTITHDNVLQCIAEEIPAKRMVTYSKWQRSRFDCNIQQIKRREFDVLYYGLFFADQVLIFRIPSKEIGKGIGYSDKQHKGNVGEGQFHVTEQNLKLHLDRYLYKMLTYEELAKLLTD
jgi:hypothetical protein